MTDKSKKLGNWGEAFAVAKLQSFGYTILQTNWKSAAGEVDIVAETSDSLVFVEVKTRSNLEHGHPTDAVNADRIQRIQRAAQMWPNPESKNLRLDVFAIYLNPKLAFEHYMGISL